MPQPNLMASLTQRPVTKQITTEKKEQNTPISTPKPTQKTIENTEIKTTINKQTISQTIKESYEDDDSEDGDDNDNDSQPEMTERQEYTSIKRNLIPTTNAGKCQALEEKNSVFKQLKYKYNFTAN